MNLKEELEEHFLGSTTVRRAHEMRNFFSTSLSEEYIPQRMIRGFVLKARSIPNLMACSAIYLLTRDYNFLACCMLGVGEIYRARESIKLDDYLESLESHFKSRPKTETEEADWENGEQDIL